MLRLRNESESPAMPAKTQTGKILYWDACVFVSLIERTPDRIAILEGVLDAQRQGDVVIYTSVLTIAEVAFVETEKEQRALNSEIEEKIGRLWLPDSPFQLVEVYPALTARARELMRVAVRGRGAIPKPADAIHLASAERIGAAELHTYDHKMCNASGPLNLNCRVENPSTDRIAFPVDEDG